MVDIVVVVELMMNSLHSALVESQRNERLRKYVATDWRSS